MQSLQRPAVNVLVSLSLIATAAVAAAWIAACAPGPPRAEPLPAEPDAKTAARSPAALAAERSLAPAAQAEPAEEKPPANAVDESLITLLYTVNNMGYTGTCG